MFKCRSLKGTRNCECRKLVQKTRWSASEGEICLSGLISVYCGLSFDPRPCTLWCRSNSSVVSFRNIYVWPTTAKQLHSTEAHCSIRIPGSQLMPFSWTLPKRSTRLHTADWLGNWLYVVSLVRCYSGQKLGWQTGSSECVSMAPCLHGSWL